MREVLLVSFGGALGALSRYSVGRAMARIAGTSFPFGTLTVNCLGSLLIGFFMQLLWRSDMASPSLRLTLIVGFLGAFTTFSAFSYETVTCFRDGNWQLAAINIVANLTLGIGFVLLGMAIARSVFKAA